MRVIEDIQLSRLNKRARRRRTVTRSAQRSGSGPLLDTAHRGPGRRRLGHRVRRCPVPLFGQHRGPGRRRLGHHPTPRILGQHRGPGRRRRLGHRVRRCPGPLLLPRTVTRRAPRTGRTEKMAATRPPSDAAPACAPERYSVIPRTGPGRRRRLGRRVRRRPQPSPGQAASPDDLSHAENGSGSSRPYPTASEISRRLRIGNNPVEQGSCWVG